MDDFDPINWKYWTLKRNWPHGLDFEWNLRWPAHLGTPALSDFKAKYGDLLYEPFHHDSQIVELKQAERFEWVAEHVVSFRPVIHSATMVYIDGEGYEKEITFLSKIHNPSNTDLLNGCIELALGQEIARERLKDRASEDGVVVNTKSTFNQP